MGTDSGTKLSYIIRFDRDILGPQFKSRFDRGNLFKSTKSNSTLLDLKSNKKGTFFQIRVHWAFSCKVVANGLDISQNRSLKRHNIREFLEGSKSNFSAICKFYVRKTQSLP